MIVIIRFVCVFVYRQPQNVGKQLLSFRLDQVVAKVFQQIMQRSCLELALSFDFYVVLGVCCCPFIDFFVCS